MLASEPRCTTPGVRRGASSAAAARRLNRGSVMTSRTSALRVTTQHQRPCGIWIRRTGSSTRHRSSAGSWRSWGWVMVGNGSMLVAMPTPVARRAAAAQCRTRACSLDSRDHGLHAPAMFDPRSVEYLGDPYAQLAALRAQGPSYVDPDDRPLVPVDVRRPWKRDCRRSCAASEGDARQHFPGNPFAADGPGHAGPRRVIVPAMTNRSVQRYRERAQQIVDDALVDKERGGELRVVDEIGFRLPYELDLRPARHPRGRQPRRTARVDLAEPRADRRVPDSRAAAGEPRGGFVPGRAPAGGGGVEA